MLSSTLSVLCYKSDKSDLYKILVKQNSKFDNCNFAISKNPLTIFLINVRISIWNFLFYKKTVREKVIVFKVSKASYFLFVGRADIVLFWDI